MGSRNALSIHEQFRPDILVIPEYANADDPCDPPQGYSRVSLQWKRYRSLAVLAADRWTLHQPNLEPIVGGIILPVEISGPTDLRLIAVAAALSTPTPKINPIVEAANAWHDWLQAPLVVAGDFGSSTKGDRKPKPSSQQHAPVLEALESLGLRSAYHAHFGVAQGKEQHATYWQFGHEDKPFHIDYVFTSPDLTVTDVEVGTWKDFHTRSDHAPMLVQLAHTNQEAT